MTKVRKKFYFYYNLFPIGLRNPEVEGWCGSWKEVDKGEVLFLLSKSREVLLRGTEKEWAGNHPLRINSS